MCLFFVCLLVCFAFSILFFEIFLFVLMKSNSPLCLSLSFPLPHPLSLCVLYTLCPLYPSFWDRSSLLSLQLIDFSAPEKKICLEHWISEASHHAGFGWVLGSKLRSPCLSSKHCYLLSCPLNLLPSSPRWTVKGTEESRGSVWDLGQAQSCISGKVPGTAVAGLWTMLHLMRP